jgi:CRISPR/Cas system CMR subunit Cmr4 (Cas7 group RAMP superfamily)
MASRNILHPTDTTTILIEQLDRQARDTMASDIARRFVAAERNKRHTRTEIRPLAFPVWVAGQKCCVAVHVRYVLSRPREHVTETSYFETAIDAVKAHPDGKILADVERVQPRLSADSMFIVKGKGGIVV